MIDCATFHRLEPNSAFSVAALPDEMQQQQQQLEPPAKRQRLLAPDKDKDVGCRATTLPPLSTEQCLLANAIVRGFSFTEKLFLDFFIEQLSLVAWNDKCFDQLVLPQSQKDLVQALVATHSQRGDGGFDDIIKGKGKGLIMVLHGPPGVGKTLTAECVAEFSKQPLYIVSSGDLGTRAETLDQRLSRILDMASTWKCVLLIDEADGTYTFHPAAIRSLPLTARPVFLEERTSADIERNSLVSIFLRVLEYYQGILFLTTNRITTFDDAFKSRIHVPLRYSNLPFASRRQIWKTLLAKVEDGADVDDADLDVLGQHALNGRQVKNVVRTARSLARFGGRRLGLAQLQQVVEIQQQFEHDLSRPQGLPTP